MTSMIHASAIIIQIAGMMEETLRTSNDGDHIPKPMAHEGKSIRGRTTEVSPAMSGMDCF